MADELVLQAWLADFGLLQGSVATRPLHTLMDRRETRFSSSEIKWEYRGKYQDGSEASWLLEVEMFDSFTPPQLDVFHAIWNQSQHKAPTMPTTPQHKTKHLSCEQALKLYPIGTRGIKTFGGEDFQGRVYHLLDNMWRVRYVDNAWEDLMRARMESFVGEGRRGRRRRWS